MSLPSFISCPGIFEFLHVSLDLSLANKENRIKKVFDVQLKQEITYGRFFEFFKN